MKTTAWFTILISSVAGCGDERKGEGASCETDKQCRRGLICDGVCTAAPVDSVPPGLFTGSVEPSLAKQDTLVTLRIHVTEPLASASRAYLTHGDSLLVDLELTAAGADVYTTSYAVEGTEPEGVVSALVDLVDAAGNRADAVAIGTVSFDFTEPEVLGVSIAGTGKVGAGGQASISFTVSEVLTGDPTAVLADQTALTYVETPTTIKTFLYTPSGAEPEGRAQISITMTDLAGNTATAGPFNGFWFDFTLPVLVGTPVITQTPVSIGASDTVEVVFDTSEPLHEPVVVMQLTTVSMNMSVVPSSVPNRYSARRTLAPGVTTGSWSIEATLPDEAGNVITPTLANVEVVD